jgi:transcriptional regulator with XRE-family HTH domain
MMQTSLGHKLRLFRAERQMSLRQAAAEAGLAKETISEIERGLAHPHDVTLAKLAKAYDVPLEELLEEPEPAVPLVEVPRGAGPTEDTRIADRRRVADVVEAAHNMLRSLSRSREQDRRAVGLLTMMTYLGLYDWISTTESLAEAEGESPASRRAKRELETAVEAIGETATAIMAGTESEKDPTITRLKDYRRAKEAG